MALDYFNDIIEMESEERQTQPGAVPHVKIVAGNKCDLANSRQVTSQEGLAWARSHDCGCVSVCLIFSLYLFWLEGCFCFEGHNELSFMRYSLLVALRLHGVLECSSLASLASRLERMGMDRKRPAMNAIVVVCVGGVRLADIFGPR